MRTLGLASLICLALLITGCGNVFIRANWNGNNQTANGFVNFVQLTFVTDGNNVSTQVTIVTLQDNFGASDFSFCGDQRSQFPPDRFAQATFTPGTTCSTLVSVVIKV
ncbi:MAG: hypothetical protein DMG80_08955 [Acidobacteria bacterium]|nr:MAG: hypothetical protein DMG80_08955 [Acidobacteriota bacterium]